MRVKVIWPGCLVPVKIYVAAFCINGNQSSGTWQYQKSVVLQKWVLDSLKACVRGWMGTRTLLGGTRKFKRTWQKIFTWNGTIRGKELNAKCDYEIMKGNDELLEDVCFSKESQKSTVDLAGLSRDKGKAFSSSNQERNKKRAVKSYVLLCFVRLKPAGTASGVWVFIVLWMKYIVFQSS